MSKVEESSDENSLSISLPSEGSQKRSRLQLSEVRSGILKIFDEAERNDHVDGFDVVRFDEKHEYERTEKMISSKSEEAWTEQNVSLDNDSGIDRAGSRVSVGSSGKVWTKIQKQINRRFGGSTGSLSSTSPVSEKASKAVTQMDSPPEGNLIVA